MRSECYIFTCYNRTWLLLGEISKTTHPPLSFCWWSIAIWPNGRSCGDAGNWSESTCLFPWSDQSWLISTMWSTSQVRLYVHLLRASCSFHTAGGKSGEELQTSVLQFDNYDWTWSHLGDTLDPRYAHDVSIVDFSYFEDACRENDLKFERR